jgi:hypothetical protein
MDQEIVASYVDDAEVEVTAEPAAEPAETETEEVEAADAEPAEVEAESNESEESESESEEPASGHNRDRGLTQMQQWRTTFEKQTTERFDSLSKQLEKLTSAIEARGGSPTQAQAEKVEQVKDEIDDLLEKLGDDDIVEGGVLKKVLARKSAAESRLEALEKRLEERESREIAAEQERAFRTQFAKQNPEVAGQVDDLLDKAGTELKELGIDPADETNYRGAFNATFLRLVKEAKAAAKAAKSPKAAPAKTPAVPSAAMTVKAGATAARSATPAKPTRPPSWAPD